MSADAAIQIVLGVVMAALAVGYAVVLRRLHRTLNARPRDILTQRIHAKVIITLKSGDAFRGVLREQDARAIVLVNADALGMGERNTDIGVDGELLVLREEVAYLQVL